MGIIEYAKETRTELKYVSWPTRGQTIAFSILVIVLSLLVAVYLGLLDYILKVILQKFIG